MSRAARLLAALALATAVAGCDRGSEGPEPFDFDEETVRLAATLPVQEGGRVKPLHTLAGVKLLKLNGRRAVYAYYGEDGREKLGPTDWALHCLLFPDRAKKWETFLVQNSEVLDRVGLEVEGKKKRDRYTYEELRPAREPIFRQAGAIRSDLRDGKKKRSQLSPVESQLIDLDRNLSDFELLISYLNFGRYALRTDDAFLSALFQTDQGASLSSALAQVDKVRTIQARFAMGDTGQLDARTQAAVARGLEGLERNIEQLGRDGVALALIPPAGDREAAPEWLSPTDLTREVLSAGRDAPFQGQLETLRALEALAGTTAGGAPEPKAIHEALADVHERVTERAAERGEYDTVPLEVKYYRWDLFYRALILYVFAFVAAAVSWMCARDSGAGRWLYRGTNVLLVAATALLVVGVAVRCVIRGRPPVSTLYETILFITGCAAIVCLVIEYLDRQRIAQALATVFGAGGLFLAYRYELHEAVDTMPSLQAVLDTNFWLSTHVTTVTLGYMAGLLAGVIGHLYLVHWAFGRIRERATGTKPDLAWGRNLARLTYGVLCFGLFFSVVGTILGGVWANYSWGRFWGWDPKENGALMIVLWELAILHARMGGYIKHFGLCFAAVLGMIVVAFSWWGVNLLEVGLHSYGFTSGVKLVLVSYYGVEGGFLALIGAFWLADRYLLGGGARPGPEAAAEA